MPKRAQPEYELHCAVVAHLEQRATTRCWKHCPNGGFRNVREAARFKRMGVKAGVPDIELYRANKAYALELKVPGGRVSTAQAVWAANFVNEGGTYAVHDNIAAALAQLEHWGLLRPAIDLREAAE